MCRVIVNKGRSGINPTMQKGERGGSQETPGKCGRGRGMPLDNGREGRRIPLGNGS